MVVTIWAMPDYAFYIVLGTQPSQYHIAAAAGTRIFSQPALQRISLYLYGKYFPLHLGLAHCKKQNGGSSLVAVATMVR